MGRPRALVAVLAGCLLLAGCGSGPSQVGAAAIINGRTISVDDVQRLIDKAVKEQPAAQQLAQQHKLSLVGREIVRQEVLHDLTALVAKRENVSVSAAELAAALQNDPLAEPMASAAGETGNVAPELVSRIRDRAQVLTDLLLQEKIGQKTFSTQAVTIDALTIGGDDAAGSVDAKTARDKAFATAKRFASSPEAAANEIKQDKQPQVGLKLIASQTQPGAYPIFGAPVNSVLTFQLSPQQLSWVVVVVRARTIGAPAPVDPQQAPGRDQVALYGLRVLQSSFAELNAKINPRYGVWDPIAMGLAENEVTKQGELLPISGTAPKP
ncbi:hypothetical protein AB5J62_36900 [Amycolatopsis sp. cg5]|uniref:hypothetical protein n=1 Tax=Amycolatopsis sp. cg5 TaxID=3238802 RepID=UPI0035252E50